MPVRDLAWDTLVTTAERLSDEYMAAVFDRGGEFELQARRQRSLRRWRVTEGFWLWLIDGCGESTVFEPVRSRPLLTGSWSEVKPIQRAASSIGARLRAFSQGLGG